MDMKTGPLRKRTAKTRRGKMLPISVIRNSQVSNVRTDPPKDGAFEAHKSLAKALGLPFSGKITTFSIV